MNLSTSTASIAVSAVDALFNSGSLVIYSGTMPGTPETSLSGNTALVTFTFAGTAFGTPAFSSSFEQATGSFVSSSVSPAASGTASFARATVWAWTASTPVVVGQYASNGSNLYQCITAGTTAASGGPTTTGASIADNTATWKYISAANSGAAGHVICDLTVGTSATDIVIGSTTINTGVTVTISSYVNKMAAV